jgi:hypothetical protein
VKKNNIPYLYPVGISGWKIYPHNIFTTWVNPYGWLFAFSCSLEGQHVSWVDLHAQTEFTLIGLLFFIQNIVCRRFYCYRWRCFKYNPKLNLERVDYYISCTVLGTISTIHPWEHDMARCYNSCWGNCG